MKNTQKVRTGSAGQEEEPPFVNAVTRQPDGCRGHKERAGRDCEGEQASQ